MTILIGIDPSTRACGWGILDSNGDKYIASGCIEPPAKATLSKRVEAMFWGIEGVTRKWKPTRAMLESVIKTNIATAIAMAKVHGAVVAGLALGECSKRDWIEVHSWRKRCYGTGKMRREEAKQMARSFVHARWNVNPETDDECEGLCIAFAAIRGMS